jgi:integrase/recombinase XerD
MSSHKVHYDACPLGHANLSSTARYTRVSNRLIRQTESPLDRLTLEVVPPA